MLVAAICHLQQQPISMLLNWGAALWYLYTAKGLFFY